MSNRIETGAAELDTSAKIYMFQNCKIFGKVLMFIENVCWAEAHIKITRMTLTIKLDRNWSSFQLANSTPPLSVTGSAIAPSARMVFIKHLTLDCQNYALHRWRVRSTLSISIQSK